MKNNKLKRFIKTTIREFMNEAYVDKKWKITRFITIRY